MSEYLRFSFPSEATIEKGSALTNQDQRAQHIVPPFSVGQAIPDKTDHQKEVEVEDPKIVATRERKARAAAKKREKKKQGGDGGEGSRPKTKRRKTVDLKDRHAAFEATSSPKPIRTLNPTQPSGTLAATAESPKDRSPRVSPHDSANHSVHNYSDTHRDEETNSLRLGSSSDQSGRALTNVNTKVIQPSLTHQHAHRSPTVERMATPLRTAPQGANTEAGESSRGSVFYEESNALNNATALERAWFSLARGALAQTDVLERFENPQADFGRLAKSHTKCEDMAGKLVQARLDLEQSSHLYTSISDRYKAFKSNHEGCAGKIEGLENHNRELSQVNKDQALRIKELEDALARKDSALVYAERFVALAFLYDPSCAWVRPFGCGPMRYVAPGFGSPFWALACGLRCALGRYARACSLDFCSRVYSVLWAMPWLIPSTLVLGIISLWGAMPLFIPLVDGVYEAFRRYGFIFGLVVSAQEGEKKSIGNAINKVPLAFNSFFLANLCSAEVRATSCTSPLIILVGGVADKTSDALKNKLTRKVKKPVVGKDKDKPKNIAPDVVKEKFKPNPKPKVISLEIPVLRLSKQEENPKVKAKVNVKRKMILSKEGDRKKKLKGKSKKDVSDSELEIGVVDYSSGEADRKRKKLKIKAGLKRKRSGSDSSDSSEIDTKSIKLLISKLEKKVKKEESDENSILKEGKKKEKQLTPKEGDKIEVTPSKIHDMLGVPFGGYSLFDLDERETDHEFVRKWAGQFYPLELKKVRVNDIARKLIVAQEINFFFKVNFLTLFTNTMGKADGLKGQICLDVVGRLREDSVIYDIDWCVYIYDCRRDSKLLGGTNHYLGPLTFLILLYLNSMKFDKFPVVRTRPAIRNWSSYLMKQRQELELKDHVVRLLDLHDEWNEAEVQESEGFIRVNHMRSCLISFDLL
nr:hypothetical protein [Tanacetum cinerariifolium]